MLQRAANSACSWWWASHIRTKQSKWLEQSLSDMEEKVQGMLKLIEEDGDSFAKRAEMYYKRRPELISSVEDTYRAFKALADRYDLLSKELQNANHTIATVFPEQVQFAMEEDEDCPTPKFHKKSQGGIKGNVPKAPKAMENLKGFINTASKQFQGKKPTGTIGSKEKSRSSKPVVKSGLSKEEALVEIDKLQKDILSLQTVKEFVKSSYENGLDKYWEIENQITEMQEKVCRLQDEFDVETVIEDNEARTLMAEAALKSCQETLSALEEKQKKSTREAKEESKKIEAASELLIGIRREYMKEQTNEEKPRQDDKSTKDVSEKLVEGCKEIGSLNANRGKSWDLGSMASLTVSELAEKIDELVNKVISLETAVSSQTVLINTLRTEADDLHTQIKNLEGEKETLIGDTHNLSTRVKKMEDKLSRVQDLNKNVESQNSNLQMNFAEARSNLDHLSEKLSTVKPDEDTEETGSPYNPARYFPEPKVQKEMKDQKDIWSQIKDQNDIQSQIEDQNDVQSQMKDQKEVQSQIEDNVQSQIKNQKDVQGQVEDQKEVQSQMKDQKEVQSQMKDHKEVQSQIKDQKDVQNQVKDQKEGQDQVKDQKEVQSQIEGKKDVQRQIEDKKDVQTQIKDQKDVQSPGDSEKSPTASKTEDSKDVKQEASKLKKAATFSNDNSVDYDDDPVKAEARGKKKKEDDLSWQQMLLSGTEDREKILLKEYTTILRNYKDVKRKLSDTEKKERDSQFDITLQMRELKQAIHKRDQEIQRLNQKLSLLQSNSDVKEELSDPLSNSSGDQGVKPEPESGDLEEKEDYTIPITIKDNDISVIEEKLRTEIDAILDENLDFWLRFSTAFHQVQKFKSGVQDLQDEISKLKDKTKHEGSITTQLKSEARPIYKHLREIQTELTVWLDQSVSLKDELKRRLASLCSIQEEITKALKEGVEEEEIRFSSHQAAKLHGETLNMKQENNKVREELQTCLDHVRTLQVEIEKTLRQLNQEFGVSSDQPKLQQTMSRSRVPLRAFIFGTKPKKQKNSLFSFMQPNRKFQVVRAGNPSVLSNS